MSRLLKADLYRVLKSRLTLIALILALAFPVLTVLLYAGIRAIGGLGQNDAAGALLGANSIIGSVYSLSNNVGLVIPVFAGILVCLDHSNGTLRNKVIAGNRRTEIYFSHLIVSILFSVALITIYAAVSAGLSLLFFPFSWDSSLDLGPEILYFVLNGTMAFVFIATVSTMFAMSLRSAAPAIIFTIITSFFLVAVNSVVMMIDYEEFKYAVYFIPTFAGNIFTLNDFSILGLLNQSADASRSLIFAEAMLSYLFFGVVNTLIGLTVFKNRDIK